jgi:hypothetical protein
MPAPFYIPTKIEFEDYFKDPFDIEAIAYGEDFYSKKMPLNI